MKQTTSFQIIHFSYLYVYFSYFFLPMVSLHYAFAECTC